MKAGFRTRHDSGHAHQANPIEGGLRPPIGLAWLGLAWFGLVWLGLAWFGLDWIGLD
jgi:hypothetical protein